MVVFQPVHIGLKFWKLRGPDHAIAPYDKRRTDFAISMLARMQIEHEVDQRALELSAQAGETNEAAPAQFRRSFKIEQLQLVPSVT